MAVLTLLGGLCVAGLIGLGSVKLLELQSRKAKRK